jgi:hypothetical protein
MIRPEHVTSQGWPHNLPQPLTSFIGREREIAEATRRLSTNRLVTLAGPGGVGKSRLALEVAASLLGTLRDGIWLVELAALADETQVPQAVATVLGVRPEAGRPLTATLAEGLRAEELLLVLDNCEHLIEACAEIADALLPPARACASWQPADRRSRPRAKPPSRCPRCRYRHHERCQGSRSLVTTKPPSPTPSHPQHPDGPGSQRNPRRSACSWSELGLPWPRSR